MQKPIYKMKKNNIHIFRLLTKGFVIAFLSMASLSIYAQKISLIPKPVQVNIQEGYFRFSPETVIYYHTDDLKNTAQMAADLWENKLGFRLRTAKQTYIQKPAGFVMQLTNPNDKALGNEGYKIEIDQKIIFLSANTNAGLFYGIQTISQMFDEQEQGLLPACQIMDYPRFPYRGMHLDVSRHFMPLEFIYKTLDRLAMHKLNVFHWHLVDDQGWRLEIKKYPRLTEIGAWRVDLEHRDWEDRPLTNDRTNATYGGFYTQEEVKAVVKYAEERHITVIPEIEMPAHVMSALAAYPQFSCTGEDVGIPAGGVWPITHIYCAGNDSTFIFLEDVLTEVMGLFPSTYIHIGGDEADKANWRACPKCQARIKNEKLADEDALQSYFIKRIEKFLNAHGRRIIGWDEILEGGLAPNATVMSWRGESGGIEAAKHGHTVIMTPGSHCYFDHPQGDPSPESLAIGGFTTLSKVYHYEPVPAELTAEEAKFVLGAQANHWAELMHTPQDVENKSFPRLAALAEVLWSEKEARNWDDFLKRMTTQYQRYDKLGINYSRSAYHITVYPEVNEHNRSMKLTLKTDVNNPLIRYTLDGSNPKISSPVYKGPIEINKTTRLKAAVYSEGERQERLLNRNFEINKSFAGDITFKYANSPQYSGQGKYTLVNGIRGGKEFNDGNWLGFLGNDVIATIELPEPTDIKLIEVDALQNNASWIFYPEKVIFEISQDGKTFTKIHEIVNTTSIHDMGKLLQIFSAKHKARKVRFVRVHMTNQGVCPPGHAGEGQPSWVFVSEITVK